MKRTLEVAGSLFCLVLVSPLLAIIALSIKAASDGPVLYRQKRSGIGGKPFTILKFRTMKWDPSTKFQRCTTWNDPRITTIGRLLRITKMDELPQLINILRGDMTFFGPRPFEANMDQRLAMRIPNYSGRYAVKPGLTNWSQLRSCGYLPLHITFDVIKYGSNIHHSDTNKVCVQEMV